MWLLKGSESAGGSQENSDGGQETRRATEDMREQFEQQQVLLQQLKDLVRENEEKLLKKEQDLEESASKLSKLKLQHKAKIVQLNNKLLEVQKNVSGPVTEKKPDDEQTTDALSVDTSRGKVLMLKKQLEESRAVFERRQKEMADNKNSAEEVLASLKIQLEEKDKIIALLKSENPAIVVSPTLSTKQDDTGLQEMYAQIVYKDSKIMDLDSRILQLERQVMDLQETVSEKEEVIQMRNKAIQLLTEDLSRRGKVVVDQLDDTRDEMRLMQENFAALEADWRAREDKIERELHEAKIKFDRELSEKHNDISVLKTSLSKLENVRFDLVARNAQLQEKVVRLQESLEKTNGSSVDEIATRMQLEIDQLKEELKKKDLIVSDLQQSVGGTSKASNQKLIKLKAQHKSQVRALELQIKDLKSSSDSSEQLTSFQNRISVLEEEKGNLQLRLVDYDECLVTSGQLQNEIRELKEKLVRQSSDLDEHVKMISMVQGKHFEMIEQLAEKNRNIEYLEVAHHEANSQLHNEREIKAHLDLEVTNIKKSNKDLLSQLEVMKSKYDKEYEAISNVEKENLSLKAVNEELRDSISELTLNLSSALTAGNRQTEGLRSKNELVEKLQEDLFTAKREWEKEIEDLKAEKDHSNVLIQEKDAFILQQKEEIEKLASRTAQLTTELHKKSDEANVLSATIAQLTHEMNVKLDNHSAEERKLKDKMTSLIEQLGETEAEVQRLQATSAECNLNLQNIIHEKDDALDKLYICHQTEVEKQNELAVMEDQNAALIKQRDCLENTIQENIIKLEELNRQMHEKEDRLNNTSKNVIDLEEELMQATNRLKTFTASKQEEVEILQISLQDSDAQCVKLKGELQNVVLVSDKLQKKTDELMDKCSTLEDTVSSCNQNRAALEQTIIELHDELKCCTEKLLAVQSELKELKESLNSEIRMKHTLEEKVELMKKLYESEIQEKQEELVHLRSKMEHLQSEGGTHEVWAKALEDDLTKLRSEIQNSNHLIEELKTSVSSYKASEDKLLAENSGLRDECAKSVTECADNAKTLESVMQELRIARADLENMSSCLQTVNSELENSSNTIDALQMELKGARDELHRATSKEEAVVAENDHLNEQLIIMDQKFGELQVELQNARGEQHRATSNEEAVVAENYHLNEQLIIMDQKLNDMSNQFEKTNLLAAELTSLREKLESCNENHEIEAAQLNSRIHELCLSLQSRELELSEKCHTLQDTLKRQDNYAAKIDDLEKALKDTESQLSIVMLEKDNLRMSVERLQFFEAEFHKQVDSIGTLESEVKKLSEEDLRLRDQSARLMDYVQQLEADLAATSEAVKEIESEQSIIYAIFMGRLEKLHHIIHKDAAPNIMFTKLENDGEAVELRDDSNFKSLFKEFDALHKNVSDALENQEEQVNSAKENEKKLHLEVSVLQENYTLAVTDNQKQAQQLLQFTDLKTQVQTLTEKISDAEHKLASADKINQVLEEGLFNQNKEHLSISEDNLKLTQEVQDLTSNILEKEKLILNIQSDYNDVKQQNESFQLQIQQMTEHVQSLQCDASDQGQRLSGQLELANKEAQSLQSEIQRLQNESRQQDVVVGELNSLLQDIKTKYNDSQIQIQEHVKEIAQCKEQARSSDEEVQARQLEIQSLTEQLGHLTNQLIETENDLKTNAKLVQDRNNEIQKLQEFLGEKDSQLKNLAMKSQENEALQNKVEDLRNSLKTANEKIADFELGLSSLNQDNLLEKEIKTELKQQLEIAKNESEQFKTHFEHAEMEWKLKTSYFHTSIQELESQISVLSSDLGKAEDVICHLRAEVQAKAKLIDDNQLIFEQMMADIDTANEKLHTFSVIISQLKDSLYFNFNDDDTNTSGEHSNKTVQDLRDKEAIGISFEDCHAILIKVQETVQENNKKLHAWQSEITRLQESSQLSASKVSYLESLNVQLKEEADQLKEQHLFLQTQLSQSFETDTTLHNLKSELESSSIEKQTMENSLKDQENVIDALLDQRRHLEERLNEFQEKLARDATAILKLMTENHRLEEKLAAENTTRISLQEEIADMSSQLHRIEVFESKSKELENVNSVLIEEKNLLEDKLNSLRIEREENEPGLLVEVERLKQEVNILQEAKLRYEEQLQVAQEEIRKLNEEKCNNERLANASTAQENQFKDLKSENLQLQLYNKELHDKLEVLQSKEHQGTCIENKESMVTTENVVSDKLPAEQPSVDTNRLLEASPSEHANLPSVTQVSPETSPGHKQLKTHLAVLQIKNEKMLSKLKSFKEKNDKLQLQINNLLTAQGLLEDDKVRLSNYNEHAKDEIGRLSSELRNVERLWKSEVRMLQDRLDTVEVANSKIVEIKEDIERKLIKQIDKNEIITNEKMALEKSLSDALAKFHLQESMNKECVDQLILKQGQLERQLDSFQKHESFLESDNTEFQHLIEKLSSEKSKSDQEIKVQSEKYVLLVQEHSKLQTEIADLRSMLEGVGDVTNLKKNYAALQKEYKELSNVKLHLESEVDYFKSELDAAVSDKSSLYKEVRSAKAILLEEGRDVDFDRLEEHGDLCKAVHRLRKQLSALNNENEELKNKVQLLELGCSQNDDALNNYPQLNEDVAELKLQNVELLNKISCLEGDIWKLEEEKQQAVESGYQIEQKSLRKALADVDKLQAENKKLIQELDNQDADLKKLETEKEQELTSRLTFQQQQEIIMDLTNQLQTRAEEPIHLGDEIKVSSEMQRLAVELSCAKQELSEKLLQLKCETEKSSNAELENIELRNEIGNVSRNLQYIEEEKHSLDMEHANLKRDFIFMKQQLDDVKLQYSSVLQKQAFSTEILQRQSPILEIDHKSEFSVVEDVRPYKAEIENLSSELQNTMHNLHAKDLRCEQLTSEIIQLIEERDSLQMRLSSLLRVDQQKEVKLKLLEKQLLALSITSSAKSDSDSSNNSYEEQNNSKVSLESLDKKLRVVEEQRMELQHINAVLDQALAAEREHRLKISADLKFANEELAGLGKQQKLKRETILRINEDYDGQVPLLLEQSQTLERSYMRASWRITNWIQGRSTPRILHV